MENQLYRGDALTLLPTFEAGSFDALITDPPYASGGLTAAERRLPPSMKYQQSGQRLQWSDFPGDERDQRSHLRWMVLWLSECHRLLRDGAPVCLFTDWRQLPLTTDALQCAGFTWRGVLVWDKTNSRPQRGRFRQQAEFVVWGSNGHMPADRKASVLPGVFRQSMPPFSKRIHQTEKPLEVMRDIVKIVEPGGIVLDPFAGAGTTVLAAKLEEHPAVGIELSPHYAAAALKRIEAEDAPPVGIAA